MAASLRITDGGAVDRLATAFLIIDGGAVDRTVTEGWVIDPNGVDRLFYNPSGSASLAVSATPPSVFGSSAGTGTVTTAASTASASGGTGPYTYAWTLVSYDATVPPTATSPTSAGTTFTQTSVGVGEVFTSTWMVTATDSLSNTATDTVNANFADTT